MATGCTYKVRNGEVSSFKDFAMQCSRAMGVAIHMRDESSDAPLRHQVVGTHHDDKMKELGAEITRISSLSADQRQAEADALAIETASRKESRQREAVEGDRRYRMMLAFVNDWAPPTAEHAGFKEFMTNQLQQSIDWDAPTGEAGAAAVSREDGETWYWRRLGELAKEVSYHKKALLEEQQRVASANAWIDALVASL